MEKVFRGTYARISSIVPEEWLERYATQAAERMVTGQLADHARTWRSAAVEAGQGPRMFAALQRELRNTRVGSRYRELVEENASYITSLPSDIASLATRMIARKEHEGERAATIANENLLRSVTRKKAMLLARTESAKANAALTQARAEDVGANWYVWQTARDGNRVRFSHRKMQGVLVNFSDPPSPEELAGLRGYGHYQAGNIFNCRCYMEILLRFDQITWPHRVYSAEAIRYTTLAQFRRINNSVALAA